MQILYYQGLCGLSQIFAKKKQDFLYMLTAKLFIASYTHRNSIYECLHFLFNFIEKNPSA